MRTTKRKMLLPFKSDLGVVTLEKELTVYGQVGWWSRNGSYSVTDIHSRLAFFITNDIELVRRLVKHIHKHMGDIEYPTDVSFKVYVRLLRQTVYDFLIEEGLPAPNTSKELDKTANREYLIHGPTTAIDMREIPQPDVTELIETNDYKSYMQTLKSLPKSDEKKWNSIASLQEDDEPKTIRTKTKKKGFF